MAVDYRGMRTHVAAGSAATLVAATLFAALLATLLPLAVSGQSVGDKVRVPTSHANVHISPGSGSEVLVLAPKGTMLTVTARRGEWIQVQLPPELRKTGMVMRWYKNEDKGWMHDSTVARVDAKADKKDRPSRYQ
jgi:uncharacterized protein YgiM (DUF1202 family)